MVPLQLRKVSIPVDLAAVQVDSVDSKDLVGSVEELEMPVIFLNLYSEEHSVLAVVVVAIHSVVVVVELEMSGAMILKPPLHCHSWKLLPEHRGKSQSLPWSIVNPVPDLD